MRKIAIITFGVVQQIINKSDLPEEKPRSETWIDITNVKEPPNPGDVYNYTKQIFEKSEYDPEAGLLVDETGIIIL